MLNQRVKMKLIEILYEGCTIIFVRIKFRLTPNSLYLWQRNYQKLKKPSNFFSKNFPKVNERKKKKMKKIFILCFIFFCCMSFAHGFYFSKIFTIHFFILIHECLQKPQCNWFGHFTGIQRKIVFKDNHLLDFLKGVSWRYQITQIL